MNLFKRISLESLPRNKKMLLFFGLFVILILLNFDNFSYFKAEILDWDSDVQKEFNQITNYQDQNNSQWNLESKSESWSLNESNTWSINDTKPVLIENPILIENKPRDQVILTWSEVNAINNNTNINLWVKEWTDWIEVISNVIVNESQKQAYLNWINNDKNLYQINTKENEPSNVKSSNLDAKINSVIDQIKNQEEQNQVDIKENEFLVSWDVKTSIRNSVSQDNNELDNKNKILEERIKKLESQLGESKSQTWVVIAKKEISTWPKTQEEIEEEKRKKKEEIDLLRKVESEALNEFYKDTDWDWLSDHIEKQIWTNYKLIDTDLDWFSDQKEIEKLRNPIWSWDLFSDISKVWTKGNIIIWAIKSSLVFSRVWEVFLWDEEIYKAEALKIIISALFPSEIYLSDDYFTWSLAYTDLDINDKFLMKSIQIAQKHNLLDWITSDEFKPYSNITRAEFIKILITAKWKPISKKQMKWQDVENDNWFAPYFVTAYELWIITSPTSVRIRPLDKINRFDAIRFVYSSL